MLFWADYYLRNSGLRPSQCTLFTCIYSKVHGKLLIYILVQTKYTPLYSYAVQYIVNVLKYPRPYKFLMVVFEPLYK